MRYSEKPPPICLAGKHKENEVEDILSHRKRRGKSQYLVEWKNNPAHENTFKDKEDPVNAKELIHKYKMSRSHFL